jgi:TRAP-type C4-dicarboxylate transport system substrate-binding protein
MPKRIVVAAALALTASATHASEGQAVTIKLATLAPAGSSWHRRLQELGERWADASGGRVKLRIYPGGVQGSEGDMLRKIAIGQLDAAALSNVGLHDTAPEPQALTVPFLFESADELGHVFGRVEPRLSAALERHGLVAVQWARIGQVRFFCKAAYRTPAELARAKLFAWDGDPASVEAWRAAGFHPVVLNSLDIVPSLQTGMIDCVPNLPVYVLAARIFENARHMIDVPWGQVMGATVIAKRTWDRVPAELRPRLLELAREVGARVDADARSADADAVAAMRSQGLQVIEVEKGPWRAAAEKGWPHIRGKVVPAELFDEVVRLRDEDRVVAARR